MWPIRSAQLSGPTEIFYITQIQKLRILTQKNIPPPPPKKALFFFGGGGVEITRPLNPGINLGCIDTPCYRTCKKNVRCRRSACLIRTIIIVVFGKKNIFFPKTTV